MTKRGRRAVVFDLDGTLRDSREAIHSAVEEALTRHLGAMPSWEKVTPHIHGLAAVHEHVAPHIPYKQLQATYDEKYASLGDTITLYDEAAAVLDRLHRQGWLLGIASTSRSVHEWLKANGLDGYFDAIVSGLDPVKRKPHPEPVLLVLQRLDVEPSQAVMVGDLPADVLAAKAAGVKATIGLTHGFGPRQSLVDAGADYIVDSLAEMLRVIKTLPQ